MDLEDCSICFCPIEVPTLQNYIVCCKYKYRLCSSVLCLECASNYITHSNEEKVIPTCPKPDCKSFYGLREIRKLPKEIQTVYGNLVIKAFLRDKSEALTKQITQENVIKKLRSEKMQFIRNTFPPSIALVADIVFSAKLKKIQKARIDKIEKQIKAEGSRKCMVLMCNGRLDKDLKCMLCSTQFCGKCEKLISNTQHVCKKEDVESIRFLNYTVKCPKCNVYIERISGCNFMTCAVCKTNFNYRTGTLENTGSNNPDVVVRHTERFSVSYKEIIEQSSGSELLREILTFETFAPKPIDFSTIESSLKRHLEGTTNLDQASVEVAKKFDKYLYTQAKIRYYIQCVVFLEQMFQTVSNSRGIDTIEFLEILAFLRKTNEELAKA